MEYRLPAPFRLARKAAKKSLMWPQVGAVLLWGKSHVSGYNKMKTHPEFSNPDRNVIVSIHAELDCLNNQTIQEADELYVYRELDGVPAMSRPCQHCMTFIRRAGIKKIFYTIPHKPYWEMEEL